MRHGLDDAAFARWWRCLAPEDQAEFTGIHGGDEVLARFVCAFDVLTTVKGQPQSGAVIVTAYAIAARLDAQDGDTRIRAAKAWRHDAVQALIDRLRYRAERQAKARISNAVTHLLETEIQRVSNPEFEPIIGMDKSGMTVFGDPTAQRMQVAKTALSFMKLIQTEDVADRAERAKRGYEQARKALGEAQAADNDEITEDAAALYLRMIQEKLGPETFHKLASHLDVKAIEKAV